MKTRHRPKMRDWARPSFTLTELLVVIMVISILASTVMFAMYGAIEEARAARTRTQITKLNEMLMRRWEGYRTRAIRLDLPPAVRRNARAVAIARLNALRDLMRMEMPDRMTDVLDNPDIQQIGGQNVQLAIPSLLREYRRRATTAWTVEFQDAECLYMIIASIRDLDGNGLDFLHEGEIGDVDGDGMPEILDAWGHPIGFLRWPAGFMAHPGKDYQWGTDDDIPSYSTLHQILADEQRPDYMAREVRDPFDPLRVDDRPTTTVSLNLGGGTTVSAEYAFNYALYPLIVSAGPDGAFDIVRFDYDPDDPDAGLIPFDYYRTGTNDYGGWRNDPYSVLPNSKRRLGEPFLDSFGYVDNIHNHALGGR